MQDNLDEAVSTMLRLLAYITGQLDAETGAKRKYYLAGQKDAVEHALELISK